MEGKVSMLPDVILDLDLFTENLALAGAHPYIKPLADLNMDSGALHVTGHMSSSSEEPRWEKEHILEAAEAELKKQPEAMRMRKKIVEHPYATIKHCMGATHFVMKRLPNVHAYNLRRVINIFGMPKLIAELQAA
jgi:hypothetical protein